MANTNIENFDKRMSRLVAKHQRLSKGYVPAITADGLIVARPRREVRWPWRPVLSVMVAVYLLKIVAFSVLGAETYEGKVAGLANGTQYQQLAAWALHADPVTKAIADQVALLTN